MRQVPAWCWPPLVPGPGSLGHVRMAPASFNQAAAFSVMAIEVSMVLGCLPPDRRATGIPQESLTLGSTSTRDSAMGISWVGPWTAMLRLYQRRMNSLWAGPQGWTSGGVAATNW